MSNWTLIDIDTFTKQSYGSLSVIDYPKKNITFDIKRIYYLHGLSKFTKERGFHAHKELKQFLICLNGSLEIYLDDANKNETIILDNPSKGLLITKPTWRELRNYSDDSVLLVLASYEYMVDDYIFSYQEFKKIYGK